MASSFELWVVLFLCTFLCFLEGQLITYLSTSDNAILYGGSRRMAIVGKY
jgi:hypothetical protein